MSKSFRYYATPEDVRTYVEQLGYQTNERFQQDGHPIGFAVADTHIQLGYDIASHGRVVGYGSISCGPGQWIPDPQSPDGPWIVADLPTHQRSEQLYRQLYRRFHEPPFPALPATPDAVAWQATTATKTSPALQIGVPRPLGQEWSPIYTLMFSPSGQFLAGVDSTPAIVVWDVTQGRAVQIVSSRRKGCILHTLNAAGQMVSSPPSAERFWDLIGVPPKQHTRLTGYQPRGAILSPNGERVVSGLMTKTLKLWTLPEMRDTGILQGHADWIRCAVFSPDSTLIATGGMDETLRIWDVATTQARYILHGQQGEVHVVAFSPDGHQVASAGTRSSIKLWDVATGYEVQTFRGHTNWVAALAFSPDGKVLASSSLDRSVKLWAIQTGRELGTLAPSTDPQATDPGYALTFSPDGKILAVAVGTTIVLWPIGSYGD